MTKEFTQNVLLECKKSFILNLMNLFKFKIYTSLLIRLRFLYPDFCVKKSYKSVRNKTYLDGNIEQILCNFSLITISKYTT